ncbi:MAG TPA: hypothetical protein DCR55_08215 [Lentisphaeria bacterium]|nr:hypothetical protein [Lentisphaeria bacterium]
MRPIQTREWSARQTDFFCRVRNAQHGQEADHARVTVTCLPENHDRKPADVLWCHARFEEAGGEVTGFDFGKGFGGGRCPTREHAGVESNEPDRRALSSSVFYSLASILLPQNQARLLLETKCGGGLRNAGAEIAEGKERYAGWHPTLPVVLSDGAA